MMGSDIYDGLHVAWDGGDGRSEYSINKCKHKGL